MLNMFDRMVPRQKHPGNCENHNYGVVFLLLKTQQCSYIYFYKLVICVPCKNKTKQSKTKKMT